MLKNKKKYKCEVCGELFDNLLSLNEEKPKDINLNHICAKCYRDLTDIPIVEESIEPPSGMEYSILRDYIKKHWPFLDARLPKDVIEKIVPGLGYYTSHPDIKIHQFSDSRSGIEFLADPDVPINYFALCLKYTGGAEYLVLMWNAAKKRFWFFDQYARFMGDGPFNEMKRTTKHLLSAIKKWENGEKSVVFSGPWGYYNLKKNEFELDSTELGKFFLDLRNPNFDFEEPS